MIRIYPPGSIHRYQDQLWSKPPRIQWGIFASGRELFAVIAMTLAVDGVLFAAGFLLWIAKKWLF